MVVIGNSSSTTSVPDSVLSLRSVTNSGDTGDHIRFETSSGGDLHAIKASSTGLSIRATSTASAAKKIQLQPGGSTILETTESGASITGTLSVSSTSTFTGNATFGDDIILEDQLVIGDGIYHKDDVNTAIKFPSNDTIDLKTNGSIRQRISSNGMTTFYKTVKNNGVTTINTGASGSFNVDLTANNTFVINVQGNVSMNVQNISDTAGASYTMIIKNTGDYDIDFPSTMYFAGGDPSITGGAGKIDILSGMSDGTNIYSAITYNLQNS